MTETRAMQILRENGVWDSVVSSRPSLTANVVNALMQAVAEEREGWVKIADEAAGPFPGVGLMRPCAEIAASIRARDIVTEGGKV